MNSMKIQCNENHWKSMKNSGNQWTANENQMRIPWKSLKINEKIIEKSMKIIEDRWKSMKINKNQWTTINESQLKSNDNPCENPRKIMRSQPKSSENNKKIIKKFKTFENHQKSIKVYENQCESMKIDENEWMKTSENHGKSLKINENSWKS